MLADQIRMFDEQMEAVVADMGKSSHMRVFLPIDYQHLVFHPLRVPVIVVPNDDEVLLKVDPADFSHQSPTVSKPAGFGIRLFRDRVRYGFEGKFLAHPPEQAHADLLLAY